MSYQNLCVIERNRFYAFDILGNLEDFYSLLKEDMELCLVGHYVRDDDTYIHIFNVETKKISKIEMLFSYFIRTTFPDGDIYDYFDYKWIPIEQKVSDYLLEHHGEHIYPTEIPIY